MVSIIDVTNDNFEKVVKLSITEEQAHFSGTVPYAVAHGSFFRDKYIMKAIYSEVEGDIVGFIMFHLIATLKLNRMVLDSFLVDKKYQRKGYGQAALVEFLKYFRETYDYFEKIEILVEPDEIVAIKILRKNGFKLDENYTLKKIKKKEDNFTLLFTLRLKKLNRRNMKI